jgi:hypothetical protein
MSSSTSSKVPEGASQTAIKIIEKREARAAHIRSGALPTTDELLDGLPFLSDDILLDVRAWVDSCNLLGVDERISNALAVFRNVCGAEAAEATLKTLHRVGDGKTNKDHISRMRIYAACLGSTRETIDLQNDILTIVGRSDTLSFSNWVRRCVGEGMHIGMRSMDQAFDAGAMRMSAVTEITEKWNRSFIWISLGYPSEPVQPKSSKFETIESVMDAKDEADLLRAVAEDRAEYWRPKKRLVVVPPLDVPLTGHKKELAGPWKALAGTALPIIGRGDIADVKSKLVARWPHAEEIVDVILGDLAASEDIYFQPTLLIGPPGSGKSAICRAIAEAVSLPVELVNVGAMADSSLAGTSAQWHSARESIPLQLIRRSKTANPAVIWDEIEKAASGGHNGDAKDSLLPMMERDQARTYRDPALEVECDLSFVSHFSTANDVGRVSGALRDRLRVLRMPAPERALIGKYSQSILEDLMRLRGLDVRWALPFAADELEVMGDHWRSGSLRELKKIVRSMVKGREANWGHA